MNRIYLGKIDDEVISIEKHSWDCNWQYLTKISHESGLLYKSNNPASAFSTFELYPVKSVRAAKLLITKHVKICNE